MRSRRVHGWMLVVGLLLAPPAWAGKLGSARASSHGSGSSSGGGRTSSGSRVRAAPSSGYGYGYGYGSGYDPFWAWWGFRALSAPWWIPHAIVGDDYGRDYGFPGAPYLGGIDGYVRIDGITDGLPDPNAADHPEQILLGDSVAIRAAAEGSWIDADVQRFGVSLLVSTAARVEVGSEWSLFQERLRPGDAVNPNGGVDHLWLGSTDLGFVFAQGPHSQFRTGLGVRSLLDPIGGNEHGINLHYAMDFYPVRPLVLSFRGDFGNAGEAVVTRLRGTGGVVVGHIEVYGGWDTTWIGSGDNWQELGGIVGGLRIWL